MKLYVPLTRDEFEQLREVARAERRRPQDQAAFLLAKQLQLADEAPAESSKPHRADEAATVAAT